MHGTVSTVSDPELIRSFRGHEKPIHTVGFSPDL